MKFNFLKKNLSIILIASCLLLSACGNKAANTEGSSEASAVSSESNENMSSTDSIPSDADTNSANGTGSDITDSNASDNDSQAITFDSENSSKKEIAPNSLRKTISGSSSDSDNNSSESVQSDNSQNSSPDYIFPDSDIRILDKSEYEYAEIYELRRGVNEIYARHGRCFSNEGQQHYFDSRSWYEGIYSPSDFPESEITDIERTNIKNFQKEINRKSDGQNVSSLEKNAINFLNSEGVNGFINSRFNSIKDYPMDLGDIVYQLTDSSVDFIKLCDNIEKEHGEIYTDITYMSSYNLDDFLRKVTGYGLGEKEWNNDYVGFDDELYVYYVEHGDTNFTPVSGELMTIHGDEIEILCYYEYDDFVPFTVTLLNDPKGFKFISILD